MLTLLEELALRIVIGWWGVLGLLLYKGGDL